MIQVLYDRTRNVSQFILRTIDEYGRVVRPWVVHEQLRHLFGEAPQFCWAPPTDYMFELMGPFEFDPSTVVTVPTANDAGEWLTDEHGKRALTAVAAGNLFQTRPLPAVPDKDVPRYLEAKLYAQLSIHSSLAAQGIFPEGYVVPMALRRGLNHASAR